MNLKGVSKETWVRMIVLAIMLINQVSVSFFKFQIVPVDDDKLYELISTGLTIVVTIWASWKNNSFTKHAQEADKHLDTLKNGGIK